MFRSRRRPFHHRIQQHQSQEVSHHKSQGRHGNHSCSGLSSSQRPGKGCLGEGEEVIHAPKPVARKDNPDEGRLRLTRFIGDGHEDRAGAREWVRAGGLYMLGVKYTKRKSENETLEKMARPSS